MIMESGQSVSTVCAVVVTFMPAPAPLEDLLRVLLPQVTHVIVIDNSPLENDTVGRLLGEIHSDQVSLVRLGDNHGVATGLNLGIQAARAHGAEFVLLSDQDSLPAVDMVAGLLESYRRLSQAGLTVAAVGPVFTDLHTGTTFPFQAEIVGRFFYGHVKASTEQPEVQALTLITSGTLIPLQVFDSVGLMREELFIDKVDLEWCLRAKSKGFVIYGTARARMFQRLGEKHLQVWWLRWRNESAYSPTRIYYQVRNFFALARLPYIPMSWKLRQAWFTFGVAYSQVIFGDQRMAAAKMALQGLHHGLCGRMGRLVPGRGRPI